MIIIDEEEFVKTNYEGYYVSRSGKVSQKYGSGIQKGRFDKDGYKEHCLSVNGRQIYRRAHRLVAKAFLDNPDNKPQINHKNGVKHDNNVSNLEWVTPSENNFHRYRELGVVPYNKMKIEVYSDGELVHTYNGTEEAKSMLSYRHIRNIDSGIPAYSYTMLERRDGFIVAVWNGYEVDRFKTVNEVARHYSKAPNSISYKIHNPTRRELISRDFHLKIRRSNDYRGRAL